jgi:hypothetical protein
VPQFVPAPRTFLGDPALTGTFAFPTARAATCRGPISPMARWPPAGAVVAPDRAVQPLLHRAAIGAGGGNLAQHLPSSPGGARGHARGCTGLPDAAPGQKRLANGIQIFPGSVPVYRGGQLVGGIGVSGDGIDQDDMISFLGPQRRPARGGIGNAAAAIRADRIVVQVGRTQVRLRYVSCPFAPFLDTAAQNVCQGL